MFNKKICNNCGEKIGGKHNFCPYCGNMVQNNEEEYGMLGKEDLTSNNPLDNIKLPFGFNTIFKGLIKQLNKEFKEFEKQEKISDIPKSSISISFSSMGGNPIIKLNNPNQKNKIRPINTTTKKLSSKKAKQFAKLPKKQANSTLRRLGNRIIYEIELPGVESIENIIINKLENSIEIKALTEKAVLYKNLNINLPIVRYGLANQNLILELQGK